MSEINEDFLSEFLSQQGETAEEIEKNDKDIFIAELLDSIEPYKANMLYDDIFPTICFNNSSITSASFYSVIIYHPQYVSS